MQEFLSRARAMLTPPLGAWLAAREGLGGAELARAEQQIFNMTLAAAQGMIVRLAIDPHANQETLIADVCASLDTMRFS